MQEYLLLAATLTLSTVIAFKVKYILPSNKRRQVRYANISRISFNIRLQCHILPKCGESTHTNICHFIVSFMYFGL